MNLGKREEIAEDPLAVTNKSEKAGKDDKGVNGHENGDKSAKAKDDSSGKDPSFRKVRSAAQQAVGHASSLGSSTGMGQYPQPSNRRVLVFAIIAAVGVAAILGYLLLNRPATTVVKAPVRQTTSPAAATSQPVPPPERSAETGIPWLLNTPTPEQQENEPWFTNAARITLKLAIGALLASLLAFRPRRNSPLAVRNPYVAQTQILLGVVAAALMMIVADNAARAFGIFAAASLVRFRTNIRDPKEITVLLISLGIGLASGVGKIEVAIILSLFSLLVLSLLEYYEPDQVYRAMELTVATRKVEETDEVLKEIFEKKNITSELRKVDREDPENPIGKIVYFVNVGAELSTDQLSEEIFSSDPDNIDAVQWDQKKTSSYIYR